MMVFNTTSAEVLEKFQNRDTHHALFRQTIYAVIGVLCGLLAWRVGYDHLLKLSPLLFIMLLLMLVLVFVPGIGSPRNGAHRWIKMGPLSFQPSEFVKIIVPMIYIESIINLHGKKIDFIRFAKILALLGLPIFLVMIEPDNGSAAVICAGLIPLFFLTRIPLRYWCLPLLVFCLLGGTLAYQLPYVRGRLEVYLHPELDIKGKGHQPHQAKIAAGSGRLFGRGPGASLQKLTYLPEAQNDYIAAIFGEEFGFVGILGLIVLYMCFAFAGYAIAMGDKRAARKLSCNVDHLFDCTTGLLNLGVVSELLPSKGVNLPFFSQGGSSLIANMIGLAILLNIATKNKILKRV